MAPKKLEALTDQELQVELKKLKSASILNAVLIGFLAGVVIYSVMKNTVGFLTLIPIFFAYKLINNSKYKRKALEDLQKQRNLNL